MGPEARALAVTPAVGRVIDGDVDTFSAGIYGCPECGALLDARPANGHCSECEHGALVRLGGDPSYDKARALIAWARRDSTQVIEGRALSAGAVVGLVLLFVVARLFGMNIVPSILIGLFGGVGGALLGHSQAVPLYRRLRPRSRLQPLTDANECLWMRRGLWAWSTVAVLGVAVVLVSGERSVGLALRRLAGAALAALGG